MTWSTLLLSAGFFLCFLLCAAVLLVQQRRRSRERDPFGGETQLLRGPGESQLRRLRQLDEEALGWLVWAAAAPSAGVMATVIVIARLPAGLQLAGVGVGLLVCGAVFFQTRRWYEAKNRESRDRYLGYFGERLVAEQLDTLVRTGWRVFHDVPGEDGSDGFGLDHVAVGPGGVFVIETKTRRRGRARPGFASDTVYFDGCDLVWPWDADNHGLEQAEAHAAWLSRKLAAELGETVFVQPVLTLPGWKVEMKPAPVPRPAWVATPENLPSLITEAPTHLAVKTAAAVAAKLEARCRDVRY